MIDVSTRAVVIAACLGGCAYAQVGSGEVAVVRTPTGMDPHVYTAGDWRIGGDDRTTLYSVRSLERAERLEVQSSDGLGIVLDTSIRFHVVPGEVLALDQELGPQYYEVLLGPTLKSQARRVVGRFKPDEIYSTQRELIERQIRDGVEAAIKGRHVALEAVLVRNVILPAQLQAAITNKLEAEQAALKMTFVIQQQKAEDEKLMDQARAEAERRKIDSEAAAQAQRSAAQASADSERIAAQAAADAKRLDAQATDDYERLVAQHLSAAILKLQEIAATKALADSPNAKLVLMGGASGKTVLDLRGADSH
ncbi:MAG TPA: prohibitin family protein [Kofleriaceae bacterium]|jgi:regulator of protease activity HflC (stomatin/prohibitin superfamily)|nr:prohibitin family protein [Kofleriaceae bacterium]